ncbi:MAG: hypothetical protein WDZ35_09760 [Crocinitomicaceae bacterium]
MEQTQKMKTQQKSNVNTLLKSYNNLLLLVLKQQWKRGRYDIAQLKKLSRDKKSLPCQYDFDQLLCLLLTGEEPI